MHYVGSSRAVDAQDRALLQDPALALPLQAQILASTPAHNAWQSHLIRVLLRLRSASDPRPRQVLERRAYKLEKQLSRLSAALGPAAVAAVVEASENGSETGAARRFSLLRAAHTVLIGVSM